MVNIYSIPKKVYGIAEWGTTFGRQSSAVTYLKGLNRFCMEWGITPSDLIQLSLSEIEELTEEFIHRNKQKISPKYLNVIYCAVKSWCQFNRKIKHTAQFRQIKFDKSSRKTRDRSMLTKEIVKKLFDNANLKEKIVLSFYGVNALRPSLIPQILLEDFLQGDFKLSAYSVEISEKAWIWVKREYLGNKANIDFPMVTTAEQSAWLNEHLNSRIRQGEKLTPKSKVVSVKDKRAVDRIVKKLFRAVGFKGRKYLLRHYAFKRFKQAIEDYDFREWLMGHKGKISAIYDHEHYLTNEEINQYKAMIDTRALHVYGLNRSQEDIIEARIETLQSLLRDLDIRGIEALKNDLVKGEITLNQFNRELTRLAQDSMNRQIETKFEQLFLKMNKKYNGAY